ncbi:preprotein translocase subunit SecA [Candidatus Parcubacteria bacterium]|nr:MAG: preprotein translocase subunit SecA [Candidatus Parcubacteria bacterium]
MLNFLFGDSNERVIKRLRPIAERIGEFEQKTEKLSNEELKQKTQTFKGSLSSGISLEDILPEAFALVREAAKRTLKQRHFDVQLMGGVVLHEGNIAEMKTGEGKTLVATLSAYLNSLSGEGVHVVTVNDYLARRDSVWMGQIYHMLGLKVACINHDASYLYDPTHIEKQEEKDKERDILGSFKVIYEFLKPISRKEAYEADIVYGTNSEFGFDYLRDNLSYDKNQVVQRGHHYAIVDEIDSILIDEARTPLIISAPDEEAGELYRKFAQVAKYLKPGTHYLVDEKRRATTITDEGIEEAQRRAGIGNIYEAGNIRYAHHLEQAVRAEALFKRDKDYVVRDGDIVIVDEFTGRLLPGRRYSEGLHQAIEAKEGVKVQRESKTVATITFQNYFRLYKKLSGMTGTALTSAQEFHKVYNIEVVVIPPNKALARKDLSDVIYKTEQAKWRAVVEEIKLRQQTGQPVLCGTTSIEKNEKLSAMLKVAGVQHKVLNAKNHEQDGEIIAQAGKAGAVTVATNIAGRGVDIILGGNPASAEEAELVKAAGGLHVIGTERHEARRIDNQLRGRAGRQGDPGSSQFFVSLEDDVIRVFGGERIKGFMETLGLPEDVPITHGMVSKAIESAQAKIESFNFDARKYVLEFDDVMNKQRQYLYKLRRDIVESASQNPQKIKELVLEYIKSQTRKLVEFHFSQEGGLNKDEFNKVLVAWAGDRGWQNIVEKNNSDLEAIIERLTEKFNILYEQKEKEAGKDIFFQTQKNLLLQVIDTLWTEHINNMEHLRDSVRLRAYGQRDPLVEYKKEGLELFKQLKEAIPGLFVANIFKVGMASGTQKAQQQAVGYKPVSHKSSTAYGSTSVKAGDKKVGRNDPCWCGSGKKFKKCHGKGN